VRQPAAAYTAAVIFAAAIRPFGVHGSTIGVFGAMLMVIGCTRAPVPPPLQPAFTQQRWPAGGQTPFGVAVADFNGDGRPDLAVTAVASDRVTILLATADGFTLRPGPVVGEVARGVVAADLNRDGYNDLVVADVALNSTVVLLGDGRGGFTATHHMARLAPFNVAVADLNNDGFLDIAVANESNISALQGHGEISLLFGDGRGGFAPQVILEADSYPADVKSADFNGDGHSDLAVVNWKSRDVSFFFGNGDGTFVPAKNTPYGGAPAYTLSVGDLDGDGRPDVVVADVIGVVHILHNDGDGILTPGQRLQAGAGARCVIVTDLNGDGRLDIATANTHVNTVSIFVAKPDGFADAVTIAFGNQPRVVAAADLNGDGRTDLVVTNGGSLDVSVLINNGLGRN